MKSETERGMRRSVPRRRRSRRHLDPAGGPGGWSPYGIDPADSRVSGQGDRIDGFDPAEFAEFLEAGDAPTTADPAFKERLRQRLWGMVRDKATSPAAPLSRISERQRRVLPESETKRPR